MIVDKGKYYLYRHIRPDKDHPFYIGIGTKNKYGNYNRAASKKGRPVHWFNVVSKNQGEYTIEILLESDDYEFIEKKEVEFVKLYGRRTKEGGILTNQTEGGKGTKGHTQTKETIRKRIKHLIGKERSKETREKISKANKGRTSCPETIERFKVSVLQYDITGNFIKEWKGISEAARAVKGCSTSISACCKGSKNSSKNFIWKYKDNEDFPSTIDVNPKMFPVIQYDANGQFIRMFNSINEASKSTGIWCRTIYSQLNGKTKMKYNLKFIWKKASREEYLEYTGGKGTTPLEIPNDADFIFRSLAEYYS